MVEKSHLDSSWSRSTLAQPENISLCCYLAYFLKVYEQSSVQFSSVQSLSRVRLFVTAWIAARQASLFITMSRSSLRLMSIESVMPSSHLILGRPLFLLPSILPASESFPMSQLFTWGGQSTRVSALASFFPKKSRADLLQNGLAGSPCSPSDSQESFPIPQFKSIDSSALSLLYGPTVISIQDCWKKQALTIWNFVSKMMFFSF